MRRPRLALMVIAITSIAMVFCLSGCSRAAAILRAAREAAREALPVVIAETDDVSRLAALRRWVDDYVASIPEAVAAAHEARAAARQDEVVGSLLEETCGLAVEAWFGQPLKLQTALQDLAGSATKDELHALADDANDLVAAIEEFRDHKVDEGIVDVQVMVFKKVYCT